MTAFIFNHPSDLLNTQGKTLGTSTWKTIEQERINIFADATNDHQWIHTDTEKAIHGPFGATIAHGFLILSFVSHLLEEIIDIQNISMMINYGCNKVRFINPVKVGAKIRGTGTIIAVKQNDDKTIQVVIQVTIEIEKETKPACVAEIVLRIFG